jgi:small nuclear ribonucleoprotein (snRNP)-like protein
VELKRDMIVRGTLESVDAGMGLTLTDVVFENVEVGESLLPRLYPATTPM